MDICAEPFEKRLLLVYTVQIYLYVLARDEMLYTMSHTYTRDEPDSDKDYNEHLLIINICNKNKTKIDLLNAVLLMPKTDTDVYRFELTHNEEGSVESQSRT